MKAAAPQLVDSSLKFAPERQNPQASLPDSGSQLLRASFALNSTGVSNPILPSGGERRQLTPERFPHRSESETKDQ